MIMNHPLRLAVGSHEAGSGKGCAMNVISWENGDTEITDMPACVDPMLAQIVQSVNDRLCRHRDGDLLCADCSVRVLALAHRTVGTSGHGLGRQALRVVWVRCAVDQARQVAHLNDDPRVMAAIEAAEVWCDDPTVHAVDAAFRAADDAGRSAADARHDTSAMAAASASMCAARAAWGAWANNSASTSNHAAGTANYAAEAVALVGGDRCGMAHRAVDLFYELTGLVEQQPDPSRTERAVEQMLARGAA